MRIRFADQRDISTLVALKHQCWEETYRGIYPDKKLTLTVKVSTQRVSNF